MVILHCNKNIVMRILTLLLISFLVSESNAQQVVSGKVMDRKNNPILGANVFFEGSYEGTISGPDGLFTMSTELTGKQNLIVSFIGFQRYVSELDLDQNSGKTGLPVILTEEANALNEVVITAGVFSAGDKKKSATMSAFDIATTPSAMGDIYGAFATMPGSQKVGEEGMLFVRGGESYETKTYMDGLLVSSPYFSRVADIPTRGRYSPLLFSETTFSTGGYSAEYGQALSSVVDLTTNGLETTDKTSVSVMTVGTTASTSKRFKNSSLAITGMYINSALQNRLFRSTMDWIKNPVLGDASLMYRQTMGESGMLKVFCSYNYNSMEMNFENFEQGVWDHIKMDNHTLYSNISYSGKLSDKWLIRSGLASSQDLRSIGYNSNPILTSDHASQVKLVMTNLATEKVKVRIGGDLLFEKYTQEIDLDTTRWQGSVPDLQPSVFIETELKISQGLALRTGVRAEYSSFMGKLVISPRISAAFKTGEFSQVSLAWGKFSQKPGNEYLKFAPSLSSEKSDHYILNFQYKKDKRIFRVETYLKKYDKLVKYQDLYSTSQVYNNDGYGFAKGLDFFWRDQESLKGSDYWISYSYLDTRRDYKDYPACVEPSYASRHNLSVVYKYFISPIRTFLGVNYSFASARPYDNKNDNEFMKGRTKPYNDLSLNLTHITRLLNQDAVIHLSITNLPGFHNVFGYRFSENPGENGLYTPRAIVPATGRQAVLMLLISF